MEEDIPVFPFYGTASHEQYSKCLSNSSKSVLLPVYCENQSFKL